MLIPRNLHQFLALLVVVGLALQASATIDTTDFPNNLASDLPHPDLSSVPSNQDLTQQIDSLSHLVEELKQNRELDSQTQQLLTSLRQSISSSKALLREKNADEAIQKFVAHTARVAQRIAEEAQQKTGKLKEDLEQFSQALPKARRFVNSLLTSDDFRRMLWALLRAFSDLFSRVAAKSSSNVEQLKAEAAQLHQHLRTAAEHGAEGLEHVKQAAQDGAQRVADAAEPHAQPLKQAAKNAVEREADRRSTQAARDTAQKAARDTAAAASKGYDDVKQGAAKASEKVPDVKASLEDAKADADRLKDQAAKTAVEGARTAAAEGRRLFLERIQPILYRISRNKYYQDAASELQDLFDYLRNLKDNEEIASLSPELRGELQDLSDEASDLVGRFTQNRDVKRTRAAFLNLYNDLANDADANRFFSDLSKVARDVTNNPSKYQDFSKVQNTFGDLYDRGSVVLQDKYGQRFTDFAFELQQIFDDFSTQTVPAPVRRTVRLAADMLATSPLHALSQLRQVATPLLKNYTAQVKLPALDGESKGTRFHLENIVFHVDESRVDDVVLHVSVGLKDRIVVELRIADLDLVFKDVHFRYENPTLADEGVLDARVKFPRWVLRWGLTEDSAESFGEATVEVEMDTLDITVQQAKHSVLDKVFLSLFSGWIKESVRSAVENALREPAASLAQQFNSLAAGGFSMQQLADAVPLTIYSDEPVHPGLQARGASPAQRLVEQVRAAAPAQRV